jgi:hypothetical protein
LPDGADGRARAVPDGEGFAARGERTGLAQQPARLGDWLLPGAMLLAVLQAWTSPSRTGERPPRVPAVHLPLGSPSPRC